MSELPQTAFRRQDETPDEHFYRHPRFVTHIDDAAVAAVTGLYRDFLPSGGAVLDLMSSWVSHLPPEVSYRRVVGMGLNRAELAANPRLDAYVVQNLNTDPQLPFEADTFDGAAIAVSVDYLTQPIEVLRDLARVLVPGGPVVITFSNRCFPTKAVAIWHELGDQGRLELVGRYLEEAGNWEGTELHDRSPRGWGRDPLFAVTARAVSHEGR